MAIYRPTPGFKGRTFKLDFIPSLDVNRPLSWQNRTRNLAVQFVSSTSVNWNHWEKVFAPTTLPERQNSSFANSKMCEKLLYCQHGLVYHVSQSPCAQSSEPQPVIHSVDLLCMQCRTARKCHDTDDICCNGWTMLKWPPANFVHSHYLWTDWWNHAILKCWNDCLPTSCTYIICF